MTDRQVHKYIMAVLEMTTKEYDLLVGPVERTPEDDGPDWRDWADYRERQDELAEYRAAQNGTL